MTIEQIKEKVNSTEYDFLRTNEHLNNNIILLGLGGSHAYGTNTETSDLDVRGIATRSKYDILTGNDFEQCVNEETDTTIYSLDKIIKLLSNCNPNTIELLGLKPEHYLYLSDAGKLLLENKNLFLSKRAIYSFGGYARAQLNRLFNKSGRASEKVYQNEARSLQNALRPLERDHVIDNNVKIIEDKGLPMLSVDGVFSMDSFYKLSQTITNVHSDYLKSSRNEKAIEHNKLSKHMMHLVRLYLMAFDILENGEIVTYREKDHDFLMNIRNGKYLIDNKIPTKEFIDIVEEYENKLCLLSKTTDLPDNPDETKIKELLANINYNVIKEF